MSQTITVTPPTSADGTFSSTGAAAWNAGMTGTVTDMVASGSSHAAGLAPDPGASAGTTKFLREDATWAAPSVTLNGIAAATASATIASGNNTGIVWNWANTSDSTVAFTFGETNAATNGTSTSGVPNQVLLKLTTLAASTQSPLSVYSRGSHVFSVSPSAVQILAGAGSNTNPVYAFAGQISTGMYGGAGPALRFTVNGTDRVTFDTTQMAGYAGSASTPGITDRASGTAGVFFASNALGISTGGQEAARFTHSATGVNYMTFSAVTFANLPAATNGSLLYCSDCDPGTAIDQTCTSAGTKTGALAALVNGVWKCFT